MEQNNQGNYQPPKTNGNGNYQSNNPNPDIPSTGLNVLSFFFPIVGLILFFVWKNEYPVRTKKIGKWAIIGFCTWAALSIIWGVVVFLTAVMISA